MRNLGIIIVLCAWAVAASAETITLKDGSRVEGTITAKSGTEVTVDVNGAVTKISGEEVKAIDGRPFACDFKALYKARSAAVPPKDGEGHYQLALWCEKNGLKGEMTTELQRVLEIAPKHEGANQKLGKVNYDGSWVRADDVKRFEGRQFSKYLDDDKGFMTHAVRDLNEDIRRIDLVNMWKPSRDQLKRMWPILNQAEAVRLVFHAKMEKSAPEIEAAWIALRSEALKGVVDSFDQNPKVEGRARAGEGIWKAMKKGVWFRLYKDYADPFMDVLTPAQKNDFYGKYCNTCHSRSYMKGGFGKEIRGTQAGVDFLEKVRALSDEEFTAKKAALAAEALKKFGKGQQTLLGKKAQTGGKRSSEDVDSEEIVVAKIMERARLEGGKEWPRTKFNYAAEIEAKNLKERLDIIKETGAKEKGSYKTDGKTQTMVACALFDGNLREIVGLRLGLSASQMAVKPSADVNAVVEYPDGRSAFEDTCTMCHDTKRINQAVKSAEAWRQTVRKRLHGAAIDDPKMADMITDYLVNRSSGKKLAKGKRGGAGGGQGNEEEEEDDQK